MRPLPILAVICLTMLFYGCKKDDSTVVTVVISKVIPEDLISISIVNQKGVNVLNVVNQGNGTFTSTPVHAGDNLTITYNDSNIATENDSTFGDINFSAVANNVHDVEGDIVYKAGGYTFTMQIN